MRARSAMSNATARRRRSAIRSSSPAWCGASVRRRVDRPYCALGSAKANVGHLDVASGVTGLIKTALALHHREIPPLANFHTPNRHIDLAGSPVLLPDGARRLAAGTQSRDAPASAPSASAARTCTSCSRKRRPSRAGPRRGAPAPCPAAVGPERRGARSGGGGARGSPRQAARTRRWKMSPTRCRRAAAPSTDGPPSPARRASRRSRRCAPCRTPPRRTAPTPDERPPLIFMFPGQGAQYPGMARALYRDHASFRADDGRGHRHRRADRRRRPARAIARARRRRAATPPCSRSRRCSSSSTRWRRLWMSWGLEPDAMVGHSVGEFVAACLAGVFSFEEGCRLVATRARIMQGMAAGRDAGGAPAGGRAASGTGRRARPRRHQRAVALCRVGSDRGDRRR